MDTITKLEELDCWVGKKISIQATTEFKRNTKETDIIGDFIYYNSEIISSLRYIGILKKYGPTIYYLECENIGVIAITQELLNIQDPRLEEGYLEEEEELEESSCENCKYECDKSTACFNNKDFISAVTRK